MDHKSCPKLEDFTDNDEVLAIAQYIRQKSDFKITMERAVRSADFFYDNVLRQAGIYWIVRLDRFVEALI